MTEMTFLSFSKSILLFLAIHLGRNMKFMRKMLAYIGRIHPSKGLDVLVKSLPLIAREAEDFMVVIAGGGPEAYMRSLLGLAKKLRVEDRVRILATFARTKRYPF